MEERSKTVSELAAMVEGKLVGDGSAVIRGVASLEGARPDAICFVGDPRRREEAAGCGAGALIVSEPLPVSIPQVVVPDPYSSFVKVMGFFHPRERVAPGVHPSAVVEDEVELGDEVHVGPLAVIGEGARIGARTAVMAGSVVGAGCEIGEDTVIHPNVTVYPGTRVGSRVIIHGGTVIGSDGFGFILGDKGHVKKPQVGTVIIEDDVEIGANCAIDRAMLDATVIGAGSKLDNLVHIAHNVRLGRHCIILATAGVGGSTRIGDYCVISGNAAIKDNIVLGDRVMVVGGSGVLEDVPAGETVMGYPAMPFSHAKRVYSRLKQLPELFKRMRTMEKSKKDG